MMKMNGIAMAVASLMASGAFAATATSTNTSPAPAKKIMVKRAANGKALSARPVARKNLKLAPRSTLAAKTAGSPSSQQIDAIQQSSSSATSAASMPGLTAGTSTASAAPKKKSTFADKVRLGVLFEFYGPSVADPFSGYQPDSTSGWSQGNASQELDTTLIVGYRLSSNLTFTVNPTFATLGDSADGKKQGSGFRFLEHYSSVRLSVGKFVKAGKFTWNGDFRVYPGGIGDRVAERPFYFRSGQNFMYSVTPKTTLAMYNTYRFYKWTDTHLAANSDAVDSRVTLSPAIEHQFTDSAVGSFSFNMDLNHEQQTGNLIHAPSYFELGGLFDVSKMLNINPYIDIYPQRANIEAWQFGANVALNIL